MSEQEHAQQDGQQHERASMQTHVPVPVVHVGGVEIVGLTRTQGVAHPESSWRTETVSKLNSANGPIQVLSNDDRRVLALIIALDQDIVVANTQEELTSSFGGTPGGGATWPKGVPLYIYDAQDLWVMSAVTNATANVTIHVETGYPL